MGAYRVYLTTDILSRSNPDSPCPEKKNFFSHISLLRKQSRSLKCVADFLFTPGPCLNDGPKKNKMARWPDGDIPRSMAMSQEGQREREWFFYSTYRMDP